MVIEDLNCRARWLAFHDQIDQVTVHEPARRVEWGTQEHPSVSRRGSCRQCVTVDLIPDGAGTRVRIQVLQQPNKRFGELALRVGGQRGVERDISRSLERLAGLLAGRGRS